MFSYARHNGLIGKERHRNLLSFQTGSRLGTQGRRQRTEISDLDFLFLCGLQPLFYFIYQRSYRWLRISRKDEVQGNFWSKGCSLVSSGSALLTPNPMAHGKCPAALCPWLLEGVPASARAAGRWQLQTGVPDAVCSMVAEAQGLTGVLKSPLRPKHSFLILRKKNKINYPFSSLMGALLAAF